MSVQAVFSKGSSNKHFSLRLDLSPVWETASLGLVNMTLLFCLYFYVLVKFCQFNAVKKFEHL